MAESEALKTARELGAIAVSIEHLRQESVKQSEVVSEGFKRQDERLQVIEDCHVKCPHAQNGDTSPEQRAHITAVAPPAIARRRWGRKMILQAAALIGALLLALAKLCEMLHALIERLPRPL